MIFIRITFLLLVLFSLNTFAQAQKKTQPYKFDEFGKLTEREWKVRFDKLLNDTIGNCSDRIYIIIYPQRGKAINGLAKKYLDYVAKRGKCNADPRKIMIVKGRLRKEQVTELWVFPAGVEPSEIKT